MLYHLPVRKQVMIKQALETLTTVRRMLQSYALTRPQVRFSLRVLDAKNEKQNWIYAAGRNATISDVILSTLGREVTTQCSLYSSDIPIPEPDQNRQFPNEESRFKIEAFLPKVDAGSVCPYMECAHNKLKFSCDRAIQDCRQRLLCCS